MELIQENYLNEERFARSFVRGKFRIKKWGRIKIKQELYPHELSDYVLKKAFSEIDEDQYIETLEQLREKKENELKTKNPWHRKKQLAVWLMNKGYESDLVWELLNRKD
jgi:regulatory protein